MNRTVTLRLMATVVPLLCLGLGAWLVWSQYTKGQTLEQDLARVEKNVTFQKSMIAEIGSQPLAAKEPSAPLSDAEQAAFLEGLRQIARGSQVTLTKWTNVAAPAASPDSKQPVLPSGITPMISNLEVNGSYEAIRHFLYEIAKAPRLLNFSSVRWTRQDADDTTTLSVTITRYVSPPVAASTTPTSSTASKESS